MPSMVSMKRSHEINYPIYLKKVEETEENYKKQQEAARKPLSDKTNKVVEKALSNQTNETAGKPLTNQASTIKHSDLNKK